VSIHKLSTKYFLILSERQVEKKGAIYSIGYLIELPFFSIGLDKVKRLFYSLVMSLKLFFSNAVLRRKVNSFSEKKDFINFVAQQFKQLSKRNLRVPIKLYHL